MIKLLLSFTTNPRRETTLSHRKDRQASPPAWIKPELAALVKAAELERAYRRLDPLAVDKMLLSAPPPRGSRFGSPLMLSQVHWAIPERVFEVSYVGWTPDGLLRHVVYLGERRIRSLSM